MHDDGGRTAFLTSSSSTAGVAAASTSLSGTGLTPAVLSLTPTQLAFGTTLMGQVSATQTVKVTNSGGTGIADLRVGVTPGFGVDATKTTCSQTLTAGASCVVGVEFVPAAGGVATGSLTVSSTAGGTSATAALSGTGAVPPTIVTTPATLVQFGTTGVGQAGVPVQVTVTNNGTISALTGLALSIDATGIASGFGLSGNTCTATLAAKASCTVNVTLVPTSATVLKGTLLVTSTNGQGTVALPLSGIGYDFRLAVVGNPSVTVVRGQTAYYTLGVTGMGSMSGAVNFQCVKVPTNALCVFNPPQLNGLAINVMGNVKLGIATGAATKAGLIRKGTGPDGRRGWPGAAMLACGLVGLPLAWRRRRFRLQIVLVVMMLAGVLSGLGGCASAGGSGGQLQLGGGTPPGSYSVTVNATSAGVTHSATVTVVVN